MQLCAAAAAAAAPHHERCRSRLQKLRRPSLQVEQVGHRGAAPKQRPTCGAYSPSCGAATLAWLGAALLQQMGARVELQAQGGNGQARARVAHECHGVEQQLEPCALFVRMHPPLWRVCTRNAPITWLARVPLLSRRSGAHPARLLAPGQCQQPQLLCLLKPASAGADGAAAGLAAEQAWHTSHACPG